MIDSRFLTKIAARRVVSEIDDPLVVGPPEQDQSNGKIGLIEREFVPIVVPAIDALQSFAVNSTDEQTRIDAQRVLDGLPRGE